MTPRTLHEQIQVLRDIGHDCQRGVFGANLAERLWDIADGLSALLVVPQRGQEEEKNEDHGGTSLTAVDSVSVSVPIPQLPHDAPVLLRAYEANRLRDAAVHVVMQWGSGTEESTRKAISELEDVLNDEVCTDGYCSTCGAIALTGANYCEDHEPPETPREVRCKCGHYKINHDGDCKIPTCFCTFFEETDGNQASTQSSGDNRGSAAQKTNDRDR